MVLGKFTPKEESMMNMFMPRVKYSVPKFQREYAWNDEKVDAFWDDMLINYEKSKVDPGNPDNQYYLGGMVLLSDPEISEKLILVDGQQRMATITMILCVIRDWLIKLSEDPNSSDELKRISLTNKGKIENFIQTEKSDGSLDDYKLELNERNKNFFRRLVLTPGNPDEKISNHSKIEHASEKNIFSCYESLNKKLSNYLEINPKKEVHPQILRQLLHPSLGKFCQHF